MLLAFTQSTDSFVQFLTVLLLFLFVVLITWFTTRWIAKIQKGQMAGGENIEIIETQKLTADKYLQIVRAGEKYLLISVGKNDVNFISELNKDELSFIKKEETSLDFSSVLEKVKNLKKNKDE